MAEWPNIFRVSSAHEEGGSACTRSPRSVSATTALVVLPTCTPSASRAPSSMAGRSFAGPGSEGTIPADLVLLAMGFVGAGALGMLERVRRAADRPRHRVARRELDDQRARRLHRRRHAARPIAHRLGDRGGTKLRPWRGCLSDGRVITAGCGGVVSDRRRAERSSRMTA